MDVAVLITAGLSFAFAIQLPVTMFTYWYSHSALVKSVAFPPFLALKKKKDSSVFFARGLGHAMFEICDGSAVAVVAVTGATERHLVALVGTTRHSKGAGESASRISLSLHS